MGFPFFHTPLCSWCKSYTPLCDHENMNPYYTRATHSWNMDSYFHEYSGIWDLNSHTPLYLNFSTVKIWTESGVKSDIHTDHISIIQHVIMSYRLICGNKD